MPLLSLRVLRAFARSLLGPLRRSSRDQSESGRQAENTLQRRLAAISVPSDDLRPATTDEDAPPREFTSQPGDLPDADAQTPAPERRRIPRPAPFIAGVVAVAFAVTFVGLLSYYGARKFTRDAADTRASEEARSLASASAYTATGDAFNGYLQMLRYADDPIVVSRASTEEQRRNAMQQLLFLNTNKLSSLAIVSRDGTIFVATDPAIGDLRDSPALKKTRASLAPTNSDIILPEGQVRGYVEFTAPLKDPDGSVWAVLYGRADPDTLWKSTLRSSVDGSHNVILNSEGLFAAGVPEDTLRQPWRGSPLDNGSVRASIVGVDSICGLGPIGRETQIDHGWHVGSCLPASLIHIEAGRAMGQQALVTSAGAILAVVLAAGLLRFALDGGPSSSEPVVAYEDADAPFAEDDAEPPAAAAPEPEPPDHEMLSELGPDDAEPAMDEPASPAQPSIVVVADVNAARVIDSYERRAARLSEQLRESVQARLLIASTQAEEAFRIAAADPARALELHRRAMDELDAVRDRELRSLAQELHPALIRLGLPGAVRSLKKEFADAMTVQVEIDPSVDSVRGGEGRLAIAPDLRLVAFRAIRSGLNALRTAGAPRCALSLQREGDWLRVRVAGEAGDDAVDESLSVADIVAFEAYGGRLAWSQHESMSTLNGDLPAPGVTLPADETADAQADFDDDEATAPPPLVVFAASLEAPDESIASSLRGLSQEVADDIDLQVDVDGAFESPDAMDPEYAGQLRMLAGVAVRVLAAAGASLCELELRADPDAVFTMRSTGVAEFDDGALAAAGDRLQALGGSFAIELLGGDVTLTATLRAVAADEDAPTVVQLPPLAASGEDEDAA